MTFPNKSTTRLRLTCLAAILAAAAAAGPINAQTFLLKPSIHDGKYENGRKPESWTVASKRWGHRRPIVIRDEHGLPVAWITLLRITVTQDANQSKPGNEKKSDSEADVVFYFYNPYRRGGPKKLRFVAKDADGKTIVGGISKNFFAEVELSGWRCNYVRPPGMARNSSKIVVEQEHEDIALPAGALDRVQTMEVTFSEERATRRCG